MLIGEIRVNRFFFFQSLFPAHYAHGAGCGGDFGFRGCELLLRAGGDGALFPRQMAGGAARGKKSARGQNRRGPAGASAGFAGDAGAGQHVCQRRDARGSAADGLQCALDAGADDADVAGVDATGLRGFAQDAGRAATGTLGIAGRVADVDF